MMWQRGPGEGFHAAKDDALAINQKLRCRRVLYRGREIVGHVVEDAGGKTIGSGRLSRDAWGDAFFKLGGRYEKGVAILPSTEGASPHEVSGATE